MTTRPDLARTNHGNILMRRRYAVSLRDLLELAADLLRNGGTVLHRAFLDAYAPHTLDLLLIKLDLHAQRLRELTTRTTKEPR